ncbi:MAG: right-handed parallel beta-helix repeat-containing protein [Candidatus Coatesbacteria bacterium]|nr:right-handed parallel beta-helix repeat-containing protein [Candidatus Coatesbacteria bacterium]
MPSRPIRLVLTSILIFIFTCCPAFALDYYVDGTNGDNANSGLIPDEAWKTITHAIDSAEATAIEPAMIYVAAATYAASTNGESFPLTLGSHITVSGEAPEMTVLDGELLGSIIEFRDASNSTLKNLCLVRASGDTAIYCWCSFVAIEGCYIEQNRSSSTIVNTVPDYRQNGSLFLRDCLIYNNLCDLDYGCIASPEDITIESCIFQNNSARTMISGGTATIRQCLFERNSGRIISAYRPTVEDTIIRDNEGDRILHLERYVAKFKRCVIESNVMSEPLFELRGGGWWMTGVFYPQLLLQDCIIVRNTSLGGSLIYTYDMTPTRRSQSYVEDQEYIEDDRIAIRRCIIAENTGQRNTRADDAMPMLGIINSMRIQDCVFWENSIKLDTHWDNWSSSNVWPYNIDHCCLETEAEGEGNFVADPLFVTGPLGDYYLSNVGAGQDMDSPCINAGSMSAAEAGLASMTTRTDGEFDTGTLDIGYHYSATPPTIGCEVSDGFETLPLTTGDPLTASFSVENAGLPLWVDIYAGFILPDGTILLVTPNGFTTEFVPFIETVHLPADYASADITVFDAPIPDGLPDGVYTFAAALSLGGEFRPIGEIATSSFEIGLN